MVHPEDLNPMVFWSTHFKSHRNMTGGNLYHCLVYHMEARGRREPLLPFTKILAHTLLLHIYALLLFYAVIKISVTTHIVKDLPQGDAINY